MEQWKELPIELPFGHKVLVFDSKYRIEKSQQGFIVLDFERKFEDPNLDKLPAKLLAVESLEQSYLVHKYEVILGEFSELW